MAAARVSRLGLDLCSLLGPSLTLMQDGVDQARPFFERPALEADAQKQLAVEGAATAIQALVEALQSSSWSGDDQARGQALLADAAKTAGVKKGVIMKSLRAALLGRLQGPDLLDLVITGQDRRGPAQLERCLS